MVLTDRLDSIGSASSDRHTFLPTEGEVPWPIEFLVLHYQKNQVFSSRLSPSLQEVGRLLADWENRVRGQYDLHAKDDVGPDVNLPPCYYKGLRSHRRDTPAGPVTSCHAIDAFLNDVTSKVFSAAIRSRLNWIRSSTPSWIPALVKWTLQLLREGD